MAFPSDRGPAFDTKRINGHGSDLHMNALEARMADTTPDIYIRNNKIYIYI